MKAHSIMSKIFFYFKVLRKKYNKCHQNSLSCILHLYCIYRIQLKKNWKIQLWFVIHSVVSQGIGSNAYVWFLCLSKPTHMPDWTPARLTFSLLNSIQHSVAYWKKSSRMIQPVMQAIFSVEFFIFFLKMKMDHII